MPALVKVLANGVGLSIQDRGRPGWRRFGVPPAGAMDSYAAAWANRLLGNPVSAPVLEIAMQGAKLKVLKGCWLALAGADLGASIRPWTAVEVEVGRELEFLQPKAGLWAYLAVPGGFVCDEYFGSVSVDARNGLGNPIRVGSVLSAAAAQPSIRDRGVCRRSLEVELQRDYGYCPCLDLLPGPQFAQFSDASKAKMVESLWTVSTAIDRTGFRLDGPQLDVPHSIPSEPVLPGSFQVPGNGQPIVTLNDGPTVGGYPKIAILRDSGRDWLCQCRPGTKLRFKWAD